MFDFPAVELEYCGSSTVAFTGGGPCHARIVRNGFGIRIRVEDLRIAALQEKFSTDSERVRRSLL